MISMRRRNNIDMNYNHKSIMIMTLLLLITCKVNTLVAGEPLRLLSSDFQKTSFTQVIFGSKELRPLIEEQINSFEDMMVNYANQLVPGTISVTCTFKTQGRIQKRKTRPRRLSNENLSIENSQYEEYDYDYSDNEEQKERKLMACGTEKLRSVTLYYEMIFRRRSGNEDVTQYSEAFIDWIDTLPGKDSIISSMKDDGVCAISARNVIVDQATRSPTKPPTQTPTIALTSAPTNMPTKAPTPVPTISPTFAPTNTPTIPPTLVPTNTPTTASPTPPIDSPTNLPTSIPTISPTQAATPPIDTPTTSPTPAPSVIQTSGTTFFFSGSFSGSFSDFPTDEER